MMADADNALGKAEREVESWKKWLPALAGGVAGFSTSKVLTIAGNIVNKIIEKLPSFVTDIVNDLGIADLGMLLAGGIVGGIGIGIKAKSWLGNTLRWYLIGSGIGGVSAGLGVKQFFS